MDLTTPDVPIFSFEDFPLSMEKRDSYLRHFDGKSQEIILESNGNQDKLESFICSDFKELCNEIEEDVSMKKSSYGVDHLFITQHANIYFIS